MVFDFGLISFWAKSIAFFYFDCNIFSMLAFVYFIMSYAVFTAPLER